MQHDEEIPGAMGTIIPAIALTALVIIGVYYSLNPPAEAPASVTSEAPTVAPEPSTNPYRLLFTVSPR
jgi:hypothetical protein